MEKIWNLGDSDGEVSAAGNCEPALQPTNSQEHQCSFLVVKLSGLGLLFVHVHSLIYEFEFCAKIIGRSHQILAQILKVCM